jgi:Ca2+-binding RTX toxin-like protein
MVNRRGNDQNNRLRGSRQRDRMRGLGGNDLLQGLAGNDVLAGDLGNDLLDGGSGRDRLFGGDGDDRYIVDNERDRPRERAGQGSDTVQASVSWQLGANIEKLELAGNAALNGTGNNLNNVLTGNDAANFLSGAGGDDGLFGGAGNDVLDGGSGADTMLGGAGDDVYLVDNAIDLIGEKAINSEAEFLSIRSFAQLAAIPDAGGSDTVQATVSYSLPGNTRLLGNVENLELLGGADLSGSGNGLDNLIIGNTGGNFLNGGAGNDIVRGEAGSDFISGEAGDDVLVGGEGVNVLDGGTGFDAFLYGDGQPFSNANIGSDIILEFTPGSDLIALERDTFGLTSAAGGELTGAGDFEVVSSEELAQVSGALIVFGVQTGTVYFNPNRSAAGFGVDPAEAAFTSVSPGVLLTASDFFVGDR